MYVEVVLFNKLHWVVLYHKPHKNVLIFHIHVRLASTSDPGGVNKL